MLRLCRSCRRRKAFRKRRLARAAAMPASFAALMADSRLRTTNP
jgi:hypothetical protein